MVDFRAYSQLNTISRFTTGSTPNATLTTVIYCNQAVGNDEYSIYGLSCGEFMGYPSQYVLNGSDYFFLYPTGDSRYYSDVILYALENTDTNDLILSSNFPLVENLVLNQNYTYRGILGECSAGSDPLGDGTFQPLWAYQNIAATPAWHVYTVTTADKTAYDADTSTWEYLGIPCYVRDVSLSPTSAPSFSPTAAPSEAPSM